MSFSLIKQLAFKNLKVNKLINLPYIISTGLMTIVFFIFTSLLNNKFILTRHKSLIFFMYFGVVVSGLILTIFIQYANGFLMKRRNKELALYSILGLDKRHVASVLFLELLCIFSLVTLIGLVGGYLFGQLSFMLLNKLVGNIGVPLQNYTVNLYTLGIVGLVIVLNFILTYLITVIKINIVTPKELLSDQTKSQGEPKSKWLICLIGFITLGSGYYIALITTNPLKSIPQFFGAIILVGLGTYCLFISFSVIVLKALKRNKKYFYQKLHFISLGRMLYRMMSNGISLASMTIINTGIILAVAVTTTTVLNMESFVKKTHPYQYSYVFEGFHTSEPLGYEQINNKIIEMQNDINKILKNNEKVASYDTSEMVSFNTTIKENKLMNNPNSLLETTVSSFRSFEKLDGDLKGKYTLGKDEVLMAGNLGNEYKHKTIVINNRTFKVKKIDLTVGVNYGIEYKLFILPTNQDVLETISNYGTTKELFFVSYDFNILNQESDFAARFNSLKKMSYYLSTQQGQRASISEINGGFYFLGILVGLLLLIGNILLIYYKQISEAFEDRKQIQIMKQVGLPDDLISKSVNNQIIVLFFLPIFVSLIHICFAFKIVYELLRLFGITSYNEFLWPLVSVVTVFSLIYLLVNYITSRTYYKLVK